MIKVLEKLKDGIDIISLKSDDIEVVVTNYGCTIMKVFMKDKEGQIDDVVLGYDTIEEYQNYDAYLGALVGRYANRIKKGTFDLNNQTYTLPINNGPNSLHGGIKGFSYQVFDYEIKEELNAVVFHYVSQDGEEGYPGELDFKAVYTLMDDTLIIRYLATTSQDTILNITNHSYFNLTGKKEDVLNHELLVHSSSFAAIDADGCPTGEFIDSKGTAFDFNTLTRIGNQIVKDDEQLQLGKGFDHPFIFNRDFHQVKLYESKSHRQLIVSTTLPGAQIYTANWLDGRTGKYGQTYNPRDAICIETQNLPDAIHIEKEPTVILKKGEVFDEETSYTFEIIK